MFKQMMGTFLGLWLFVLSAIVMLDNHQTQYCLNNPAKLLSGSSECSWLSGGR